MPKGSRRTHHKSRHGCGQCKQKRVKCDERPPRCGNCCRWGKVCTYEILDYPPPRTSRHKIIHAQFIPCQPDDDKVIQSLHPIPRLPEVDVGQLELMHHYSMFTSTTLHDSGSGEQQWESIIPYEAQSYEFLMHSILAVSALHIIHLRGMNDSTQPYLTRARSHHSQAVALFRSNVTQITRSNCTAAVSFSVLLLIFSCATFQLADPSPPYDPIDSLITVLRSFRSYWRLFTSIQQWVADGPLGGFPPLRATGMLVFEDDSSAEALRALELFNAGSSDSDEDKSIYQDTILQIEHSLENGCFLSRTLWPVLISEEYLALLDQKCPMALIILAHGGVLAKYAPYRWFLHNWVLDMVKGIEKRLDPVWRPGLAWPLLECGAANKK